MRSRKGTGANIRLPARVAFQNLDTAEDAVVITALDAAPFCCHEELVMMSRAQLVAVAQVLNEKLPAAMALDVGPGCPTNCIRSAIELIVGIPSARSNAEGLCIQGSTMADTGYEVQVARRRRLFSLKTEGSEVCMLDSDDDEIVVSDTETTLSVSPLTSPLAIRSRGENWC